MIIDFEEDTTIPLTEKNIAYSCSKNSRFMRVVRGYGIFPSKDMRKTCKALDIKEWGDEKYCNGDNGYLFKNGGRPCRYHNGENG